MQTEMIANAIQLLDAAIDAHYTTVTQSGNFDEIIVNDLKDLERIIYKGINALSRQARLVESKVKVINKLRELQNA